MMRELWETLIGRFDRRKNSACALFCPVDRRKMTAKRSEDLLRASIEDLDRTIVRRAERRQVSK